MSSAPRRPIDWPIRSRRTDVGLSTITCDRTRNPFAAFGSMVIRKSGALDSTDVIWQITIEAWLSGNASVCTITAGRGLS